MLNKKIVIHFVNCFVRRLPFVWLTIFHPVNRKPQDCPTYYYPKSLVILPMGVFHNWVLSHPELQPAGWNSGWRSNLIMYVVTHPRSKHLQKSRNGLAENLYTDHAGGFNFINFFSFCERLEIIIPKGLLHSDLPKAWLCHLTGKSNSPGGNPVK